MASGWDFPPTSSRHVFEWINFDINNVIVRRSRQRRCQTGANRMSAGFEPEPKRTRKKDEIAFKTRRNKNHSPLPKHWKTGLMMELHMTTHLKMTPLPLYICWSAIKNVLSTSWQWLQHAIEHTPRDKEVVGSNPAGAGILLLYPISGASFVKFLTEE